MKIMLVLSFAILFIIKPSDNINIIANDEEYPPIFQAVIVIGGHRSGKDTLVPVLTSDLSKLTAALQPDGKFTIHNDAGTNLEDYLDQVFYPVLASDDETGTDFYNCPHLDAARLPGNDFVADFFMDRMLKSVGKIKIVAVIRMEHLTPNTDRTNYLDLLKGISHLLPNLDKFGDSIMLAVTWAKVQVSPAELVPLIANFMSQTESYLQTEALKPSSTNSNDAPRLIWIHRIFQNSDRRAILREPKKDVKLSESKIVKAGRAKIYEALGRISYVGIVPGDVASMLSMNSISQIQEILNWNVKNMASTVSSAITFAIEEILQVIQDNEDFMEIWQILNKILLVIRSTKPEVLNSREWIGLVRMLKLAWVDMDIYLPESLSIDMRTYQELQEHLESISDKKGSEALPSFWIKDYDELTATTETHILWYDFLLQLEPYMSSGKFDSEPLEIITMENFPSFFDVITEQNTAFEEFQELKDSMLSDKQISELNYILDVTGFKKDDVLFDEDTFLQQYRLRYDAQTNCTPLSGPIVIRDRKLTKSSFIANCTGDALLYYVFGTKTVTFSEDLQLTNSATLIVIAPNVIVDQPNKTKSVEFTLRGKDGADIPITTAEKTPETGHRSPCDYEEEWESAFWGTKQLYRYNCTKAADGDSTLMKSGSTGGDFLTIASTIENSGSLTVTSVGGSGGKGQGGGDNPFFYTTRYVENFTAVTKHWTYIHLGFGGNGAKGGYGGLPGFSLILTEDSRAQVIQRRGLNGIGGEGGKGGIVNGDEGTPTDSNGMNSDDFRWFANAILNLCSNLSRCLCERDDVSNNNQICFLTKDRFSWEGVSPKKTYFVTTEDLKVAECCPKHYSTDGKNYIDERNETPPKRTVPFHIYEHINEYRKHVLNLPDTHRNAEVKKLLGYFSNSPTMRGIYDALGLVRQMALLNRMKVDGNVQNTDFFITLYEQLIEDIKAYVEYPNHRHLTMMCEECNQQGVNTNFNDNCGGIYVEGVIRMNKRGTGPNCWSIFDDDMSTEHGGSHEDAILATVIVSALGQIGSFKEEKDDDLIVKINEFLSITKEHVSGYSRDAAVINYKTQVDDKIMQGYELIKNEMQPRIDDLHKRIDSGLDKAVDNIKELLSQAEENKEKVEASRGELITSITLKVITNGLNIGAEFAKFCGPEGAAVSTALGSVSALTKIGGDLFDNSKFLKEAKSNAMDGSARMKLYLDNLQAQKWPLFDDKIDELETQIEILQDPNYSRNVERLTTLVSEYRYLKEQPVIDNAALNAKLQSITTEIHALRQHGHSLRTFRSASSNKTIAAMEKISNGINLIKVGAESATGIMDALSDVNLVDEASEALAEQVMFYDQMISTVSGFLTPMVKELTKELNGWTDGSHKNISIIAVGFSSLIIQQKVGALKDQFTQFVSAADIPSELPKLAEDLGTSMEFVTKAHEKIQGYVEKKAEIDFQVSLEGAGSACTADSNGNNALTSACFENELLVKQNNYVWMYSRSVHAFKQHVFPLAHRYKAFFFDFNGKEGRGQTAVQFGNLVNSKIDDLLKKLRRENAVINDADISVTTQQFCLAALKKLPLFTWQYKDHQEQINNLLSGEAATLYAPIYNSLRSDKYHAVRIKAIDLKFDHLDKSISDKLTNDLQPYNVRMNHSGVSQFRVLGRYYTFVHPIQQIHFQYAESGRFDNSNEVYKKLSTGDWTISPYTTWKIQLVAPDNDEDTETNFKPLQAYKNMNVDLKLCGTGQYFDSGLSKLITQKQVKDFYEVDIKLAKEAALHV